MTEEVQVPLTEQQLEALAIRRTRKFFKAALKILERSGIVYQADQGPQHFQAVNDLADSMRRDVGAFRPREPRPRAGTLGTVGTGSFGPG